METVRENGDFEKVVLLGKGNCGDVFCNIRYKGGNLAIAGVEGPKRNGDCRGSCGQIVMHAPAIEHLATGWTQSLVADFWKKWNRWHLNDMQAACEHQRARGETWKTHPSAVCPDCQYSLGSAWQHEEVPTDILGWFRALPDTDKKPAWV